MTNISLRAAAFIIKDNKLLFAKNINHPCYYIIGGGIKENETSQEAVIREIFEETGFTLEIDKLALIQERFHEVNKQKRHEIVFFYLMKNNSCVNILDNSLTDQGNKETLHWLTINDLGKYDIIPAFLKTKTLFTRNEIEHIIVKEY